MSKKILLSVFSIFILTSLTSLAQAANYYVDASNGNDNWDGLSPANAWETIAKVNSMSFQSGDFILFKRGVMSISSVGIFVSGIPFTCGKLSRYVGLSFL